MPLPPLPESWRPALGPETEKPYFRDLEAFLTQERAEHQVFPPEAETFAAMEATPLPAVKVFLLGQDPYHDDNQAHGLCFSVRPGIKPPPSLVNIYKELRDDLGCKIPNNGYLMPWAERGVLMLNAVLTVRAHQPNSHKAKGWEKFTDVVIKALNARPEPVVFLLWGGYAKKKLALIDQAKHPVIQGVHPSPLSANQGFFGSKPFSQVNQALQKLGQQPIDWQVPDL